MTELQIQEEKQAVRELNLDPITGAPGAHPLGTGIGAAGGAAAGVAVGLMAGPVGSAVGGLVGAIMGGLAGKGVGEAVNPTAEEVMMPKIGEDRFGVRIDPAAEDLYWQRAFITEPYFNSEFVYDDYGPAYRAGYLQRQLRAQQTWEESEASLQPVWESTQGASRLSWDEARLAMRAAWYHADSVLSEEDPYFGKDLEQPSST
jgi:hypothetical protein